MALEVILARTRQDLVTRMREVPRDILERTLRPSDRSFAAALRRSHTGFIMECKQAAPSAGLLRAPYDPAAIARDYAPFADAVSVLTDGPFFQGAHAHLRDVRAAVDRPVLCKDFVVDPYQIMEARAHGADAVLLMLSVLDDAGWRACEATAQAVGIETLTEVHDDRELDRALALGAPIIGINNRDLATLSLDLEVTRRLAPRIPRDRIVVGESGIGTRADVRTLAPLVDALLVGTSLMRAADLPRAVRRLVVGEVKVCGLTRAEDARAAWEAGATFGGLIFAPGSPRQVTIEAARGVRETVPLRWVGVFVNAPLTEVARMAGELRLSAVQLHGEEPPDLIRGLRGHLPAGCEIWKAVRVRDRVPPLADTGADRLLLDAWQADRRGGTGRVFDWSLLHGHADQGRIILGGGLTPANAASAAALGVSGLDVNSGVESAPGIKSRELLAAFFAALRGPGREG